MIPYGRHHIDGEDIKSVIKVLKSDNLTQGPLINVFEKEISKYVGAKYSVVLTSCTAGLHLAAIVSKINKGKVLLTSPITFVATANSSLYCGGETIFADIDSSTINISIDNIKCIYIQDHKRNHQKKIYRFRIMWLKKNKNKLQKAWTMLKVA